jgi:hypothetical protein
MFQQVSSVTEDVRPAVPAPRDKDTASSTEPETFTFVDIEHRLAEDAELDAAAAAWDGFL